MCVYVTDFAEAVKGAVEEHQDGSSGHLGDVVERLAGVVANSRVGIIETRQNWLDQLRQVHPYTGLCRETVEERFEHILLLLSENFQHQQA